METKWKLVSHSFRWACFVLESFPCQRIHGLGYIPDATTEPDQKSVHESDTSSKQERKKSQPRDQREIYLQLVVLLGVEEYFSRVPGVIVAVSGVT